MRFSAVSKIKIDWSIAARNVWVCLILGLAIHAFCLPFSHTVYDIYVGAARRWLAGEDIYVRTREYYRYSPLFAVALTPLAVLPDGASAAMWKIINCGVFALGLRAWARRLSPRPWSPNEVAAQLLLALPVALHSLYNSQANLLMLGSLLLGMAAAGEGKWNRAALWIAWATLIKGYPLALAMILIVLFPRRFAGRFIASLGAGLLLPFAAATPAVVAMQYQSWWHHLRDSTEIMRERLRSIDQLFVVFGDPLSQWTFALVGAVAGAAVLLVCLSTARRFSSQRETVFWAFLWFSLWVLLFGPATEACTYVVAAPAIAWALVEAWRRRAWWPERAVLVASLLMMGPMVTDLFGKLVRDFSNEHGSQPAGALLLLAWSIVEWHRRSSADDRGRAGVAQRRRSGVAGRPRDRGSRNDGMNRLLLHADDFGFNDAVTRGIIDGFSNGLLTGTSLLTNAPAAPLAVELWKRLEQLRAAGGLPSAAMRHRLGGDGMSFDGAPFDLGVHLNLTQGRPLTALRYPDELLDAEGRLLPPGKLFLKLLTGGRRWRATLNEELAAQIEWLLDHGLRPTHLNGHQYVEMMPVVGELIPGLAQRYGVGWVRAACEPGHLRHSLSPGLRLANCGLSSIKHRYAVRFRRALDAAGIRHADAYFGASHAGRIDLALVRRFLRLARSHAVSEIAFHPGQRCNEETLFWEADGWRDPLSAARPRELGLLGSTELSELILAANFRLTRFVQRACQPRSGARPRCQAAPPRSAPSRPSATGS